MTQKTNARIAITAFLAACLIPSAGMLLLPQGEAAANQTLAPAPRLFLDRLCGRPLRLPAGDDHRRSRPGRGGIPRVV